MQVNYQSQNILKPEGKRTASHLIAFDELHQYITIYKEVVDVNSPVAAVSSWVSSGHDEAETLDVL